MTLRDLRMLALVLAAIVLGAVGLIALIVRAP